GSCHGLTCRRHNGGRMTNWARSYPPPNWELTMPPNHTDKQPGIEDILRGLIYSHNRANGNTAEVHQASATVHALVELLIERGVLDRKILETRQQEPAERLRRQYLQRGWRWPCRSSMSASTPSRAGLRSIVRTGFTCARRPAVGYRWRSPRGAFPVF